MSALEVATFTDVFILTSYLSDVTLTLQECLRVTEGTVIYPESPGGSLGGAATACISSPGIH